MSDDFNYDVAADLYDEIMKMDDASAEMLMRFVLFDVYTQDLQNNRRAIDSRVAEINKALFEDFDRIISKGKKKKLWREADVRRDASGRFAIENVKGKPHVKYGDFDLTAALDTAGGRSTAFEQAWNNKEEKLRHADRSNNARTYARIGAGAAAVGSLGGPKAQAAGQVANFMGQHGPEAEKVLGPAVRRTAYRYRGTERRIDPELSQKSRDHMALVARKEGKPVAEMDEVDRHEANTRASVAYLMDRVPSTQLAQLHLQSGKVPPSEGILLDADGKIVAQAVGYADDHYLPFNLKNLKNLQGGTYVRSRSSGGPTTEDLYTGMVAGARSVTVVSRSGVFTVNFSDDFRGSRRYNDKAKQMVERYAMTLDAVKSKQVERQPMSMAEKAEIRAEVEADLRGYADRDEIEDEIKNRMKTFRTSTIPSEKEMLEIDAKAKDIASMGGALYTGSTVGRGDRAVGGVGTKQERVSDDYDTRYRLARQDLIDQAMEGKANRNFQLDGEGYAAALDALREQYPYYLDKPNYTHKRNVTDPTVRQNLSAEEDKGYVKPRYIRPEAAMAGYFGENIGRPKISAEQLNYANWPHNPQNKDTGGTPVAVPTSAATGTATATTTETETETPVKRGKQLTQQQKISEARATGESMREADKHAVEAIALYATADLGPAYPELSKLRGGTVDDVHEVLNGPKRNALLEELDRAHDEASGATDRATKALATTAMIPYLHMKQAQRNAQGKKWSKEQLGNSPASPLKFKGESAYVPGAHLDVYAHEWDQQVKQHELDSKAMIQGDDAEKRRWANYYGMVAQHAERGPVDADALLADLARLELPAGVSDENLGRMAKFAAKQDPSKVAKKFSAKAEAVERVRALAPLFQKAQEKMFAVPSQQAGNFAEHMQQVAAQPTPERVQQVGTEQRQLQREATHQSVAHKVPEQTNVATAAAAQQVPEKPLPKFDASTFQVHDLGPVKPAVKAKTPPAKKAPEKPQPVGVRKVPASQVRAMTPGKMNHEELAGRIEAGVIQLEGIGDQSRADKLQNLSDAVLMNNKAGVKQAFAQVHPTEQRKLRAVLRAQGFDVS